MSAMKNSILSMLSVVLLTQCSLFDDKLSLPLTPYHGEQLRMDGYYYQMYDGKFYFPCFFYKNGILITAGGLNNSLGEMDESIKRRFINSQSYKTDKTTWGIFLIEDNVIRLERLYLPSPISAYIWEGIILNDTTFHITKSYRSNGKEQRKENEIYHFREFSPKPDSTNVYIK